MTSLNRFAAPLLACAIVTTSCGGSTPATSSTSQPASPAATPAAAVEAGRLVAPQDRPQGDITFKAAIDLLQVPGAASPQLRHGIEATTADWPASLYVTFPTRQGTAACTATLVGPQAMLTAAHCVPEKGKVSFAYKSQSKPYSATCEQHPQYVSSQDPSADYALCTLDRTFVEFPGFLYESIDTAAMASRLGQQLVLTGFGCVSDIAGAGPQDGKYRIGVNTVDQTSASPVNPMYGSDYYAGKQDNNLFTMDGADFANLCPGDSGGPALVASSNDFKSRVIVGVNSRVFYRDATKTGYANSLISSTGTTEFIEWATKWVDPDKKDPSKKRAVCGFSGSLAKCRT